MRNWKGISLIFLASYMIMGCNKEPASYDYSPVSIFTVTPDSGNTTTVFHFDAKASFDSSRKDNPVFVRWDWDSDGTWDIGFNSTTSQNRRFYQKGNYTIRLEATTLLGSRDTSEFLLVVNQGYSKPRPSLIVVPDTANIYTEFYFDASGTKDDEDSLDQLRFRWDYDGDDIWDTGFTPDYFSKHRYAKDRFYRSKVEVQDLQGMTAIKTFDILVNRVSDSIVPVLTHECGFCTPEDTVLFSAGDSYKMGASDPDLIYSWNVGNDRTWEIENSSIPFFKHNFSEEGIHTIKLRVTDQNKLYKDIVYEVEIFPINSPPQAVLVIGNRYGNTSTNFYMHGLASSDREDGFFERIVQWDLNNDGVWDSEHLGKYEVWTTFNSIGNYPIALQITDQGGKNSIARDTINVFAGNHTTDILADKRAGYLPDYYGIVKIGDTWWTQSNSRFQPPDGAKYNTDVYKGQEDSVFIYGFLYPYSALTDYFSPCPDGWRIPTLSDWEQVMRDLGPNTKLTDLILGGSSELHIHFTGYYDSGGYKSKGRIVNYYTPDVTTQGQPILWYMDKLLNKNHSVIASSVYHLPARCVKDGS